MDDLENLELLSLVAKVTSEIKNHLGIEEKVIAEFVIHLRVDEAKDFDDFKNKLQQNGGADFPSSLIESIDRLVTSIHPEMRTRRKAAEEQSDSHDADEREKIFRGLAVPNKPVRYEKYDSPAPDAIGDALSMLESLEPKPRPKRPRSRSPDNTHERSRGSKRSRPRTRSVSTSPERRRQRRSDDRGRSRSRSPESRRRRRPRHQGRGSRGGQWQEDEGEDRNGSDEMDDYPILGKTYEGVITRIEHYGAFVSLHRVRGCASGLVHVSEIMQGQRVNHPEDYLTKGQQVSAKVIRLEGNRINLSMKQVGDEDQDGDDDRRHRNEANMPPSFSTGANAMPLGFRGGNGILSDDAYAANNGILPPAKRQKKRMTSPERWEIVQLIASGVAKASDYPDLEEEYNASLRGEATLELEEDVDIEVREEEPPFLAGQTRLSLELSPIRVVKAPDGSLNRAAMSGTQLARDRKEQRLAEAQAAAEEQERLDLSSQWHDPMADPNKPKFASEVRQARLPPRADGVPEWRRYVQPPDAPMGKRTGKTIKEQRESLPVFAFRKPLVQAVKDNQILIVVGETGSGKTTQLTQYLAEAGFTKNGTIGCTQPRRVAAVSVAKRVAEEVGCMVGEAVGYTIRFEDKTSPATRIKYMTDGMLLREILLDQELRRYSVIMLDEAHERTISTDVLFALLKLTAERRPELKIIVTSATLDAEKFSGYFNKCPIFTIPGRAFPVEILYSREPESDYLDAALETVMHIHTTEPAGDILLFLTGQEEIDTSCEVLFERMKALGPGVPELIILPIYSALPSEQQSRIFEPAPPGKRKVVIATNIAETSITIDHIYYVVDPGFVKQNAYDPKLGMDSLVVTPISQAQAKQRAGRAGRTGPGKCFRLYTEAAYQSEMLPTPIPEIQRQNLAHTILMLKAMGINDLLHFDFMDPPPVNTMLTALEELYALSALDDEGLLTRLGRKMADFPMEPSLSKVLLASVALECSDEMLSIVAMLNLPQVFTRPKDKQEQADKKKAKFHDPSGDHLTLLNVYQAWIRSGYSSPWCHENFIHARQMRRAKDVRDQMVKIMQRYKHPIVSCGRHSQKVRQALCAGFFRNAARKDPREGYRTLIEGTPVYVHPSSALFGKHVEWVVYHTLILTSKEYMHATTSIEPKWLVDAAPTFFKVAGGKEMSKRRKQERIQPLYNKWQGEDDWRLSAQRRGGRGGGGGGTWG